MSAIKDKFGREIDYLRISVTDKCNLRCVYCMPKEDTKFLSDEKLLTDDEIYRVVKQCANLGISKVRITGGEPLARKNLVDLIGRINSIQEIKEICMTTNAILLYDNIEELAKNGLSRVNISLDTLHKDRFKKITRGGDLDRVLLAIDKCLQYGIKVKLNIVIIDGINKDEIIDFVNMTKSKNIDIRFIELMPIGEAKGYKAVNNNEILQIINENCISYISKARKEKDGPAKYIKLVDGIGNIGFISAMSNCFCSDCNRIRVTADGFLKQCLHWNYGINLKDLLRKDITDEELKCIIEKNIYSKPEKHLFKDNNMDDDKRFMYEIGG